MDWFERFSDAVQKLYRGFLLRDVFGYMLPGALVLGFMVIHYEDPLNTLRAKCLVQYFLAFPYVKPLIVVAAVASAYLTGISIFGLGIFLGLLRYYPPGMRRLAFHCEGVQFDCAERVMKSSQERGRLVILLHATGNFGFAILLCCFWSFVAGNHSMTLIPPSVLGIAAWLRHWESVYNLRSFQEAVLDTHKITIHDQHAREDWFGSLLEYGGLFGYITDRDRKKNNQGQGKADDKPA